MARYGYDQDVHPWAAGIPPWEGDRSVLGEVRSRGMDPNFRGGTYAGERMHSSQKGQAPYGHYRDRHAGELEGFGGQHGRYRGYGRDYDRGYERNYQQRNPGGLRDDRRYLRDFNKNSPAFQDEGRQDRLRRSSGFADASPDPRTWRMGGSWSQRYDQEQNRYGGRSSAGFTEYWLPKQAPRGNPMRHWGGK